MKKFALRMITAIIVLLCVLCVAACKPPATGGNPNDGGISSGDTGNGGSDSGNGGGTGSGSGSGSGSGDSGSVRVDTAKNNKEFVAFRTKAVNIIKDAGLFVYDFDEQASTQSSALAAAPGYAANASAIDKLIMADDSLIENTQGAKSLRDDLFEQSLFISLYIGDGLTTYHGVDRFYGIPVQVSEWEQYFAVTESNGVNTVMCYTPHIERENFNQSEMYIYLKLDYKSKTDYSYEFVQYVTDESDPRYQYAYGDSKKRFLGVEASTGKDYVMGEDENGNPIYGKHSFVYYAPNDNEGYYTENYELANQIHESYLKPVFSAINTEEYKALANAQYTLTDKQVSELNKKYFGRDIGIADEGDRGIQTADTSLGKIAQGYIAANGEREVVIPDGVEYLVTSFTVWDKVGTVEKLVIPASVKGVCEFKGPGVVEADITDLDIRLADETSEREKMFCEFEVEKGSLVFRSGKGSLRTSDGKIIYLADSPLAKFDLSVFDERTIMFLDCYKHLFTGIKEIEVDLSDSEQNIEKISCVLGRENGPKKIKLIASKDKDEGEQSVYLNIPVASSFVIDVNVRHKVDASIWFDDETGGTVTLNLHAYAGSYFNVDGRAEALKFVVNADCSQELYEIKYEYKVHIGRGSNVRYNYGRVPAQTFNDFIAELDKRDEYDIQAMVTLKDVASGTTATVPETYEGILVRTLRVNGDKVGDKNIRIILSQDLRRIEIIGDTSFGEVTDDGEYVGTVQNENLVLEYPGTYAEFEQIGVNYLQSEGIKFGVDCTDGFKFFEGKPSSGGDDNPNPDIEDKDYTLTFIVRGKRYERTVNSRDAQDNPLYSLDFIDEFADYADKTYMWGTFYFETESEDGSDKPVQYGVDENGLFCLPYPLKDTVFTLVEYEHADMTFNFCDRFTQELQVPLDAQYVILLEEYDAGERKVYYAFLKYEDGGNMDLVYDRKAYFFTMPAGIMLGNYEMQFECREGGHFESQPIKSVGISENEYIEVRFRWSQGGLWEYMGYDNEIVLQIKRGDKLHFPEGIETVVVEGQGTYTLVGWKWYNEDVDENTVVLYPMEIEAIYEWKEASV